MFRIDTASRVSLLTVVGFAILIAALPLVSLAAVTTQLDFGSRGEDVAEVQTFLAKDASLYPEGLVTGYFGSLTKMAVERYQCLENIVCSGTPQTTGYGRVGPTTMARINANLGAGGGTGGSTDISAPVMSEETVTASSNSATVNWTTNETASGRVLYGVTWPFL
ncbi:MAG: peptidoglycan-binding domain-containing protein, partial [bacterium]|nr:peptidoglycan-binding domain-containing protein [bacterium]